MPFNAYACVSGRETTRPKTLKVEGISIVYYYRYFTSIEPHFLGNGFNTDIFCMTDISDEAIVYAFFKAVRFSYCIDIRYIVAYSYSRQ